MHAANSAIHADCIALGTVIRRHKLGGDFTLAEKRGKIQTEFTLQVLRSPTHGREFRYCTLSVTPGWQIPSPTCNTTGTAPKRPAPKCSPARFLTGDAAGAS